MGELYERQDNETEKAWGAFLIYRGLTPTDRSLTFVSKKLKKTVGLISKWAKDWKWTDRLDAWERRLDGVRIESTLGEIQEMNIRQMQGSRDMQKLGLLVIQRHLAKMEENENIKGDLSIARKLLMDGVRMERACLGEPSDITESRVDMSIEERQTVFQRVLTNPKALQGLNTVMEELDEATVEYSSE